jgi:O-antigen ligase
MISSFVLVYGYILAGFMISMALFPNVFARFFEWQETYAMVGGAFRRARSPLGSGISAGILVIFAIALAAAQIRRGRRVWLYSLVFLVAVPAVLLTLARSLVLAMGLFFMIYYWRTLLQNWQRAVVMIILALIVLVPLVAFMAHRFDLSRLLDFTELQTTLRARSAETGLRAFAQKPALGHGAGLVYQSVRHPLEMIRQRGGRRTGVTIAVAGGATALEPHNLYILIAVEYGGLMLLVFLAGAAAWWWTLKRGTALAPVRWRPLSDAYLTMAIVFALFSLTNSDLILYQRVTFVMWLFIFMSIHGVQVSETHVMQDEDPWLDPPPALLDPDVASAQ